MDRRLLRYDPQMELLAPASAHTSAASTPSIKTDVSGELEEVGLASRFMELSDRPGIERFLRQLHARLSKDRRPEDARGVERLIGHLVDIAKSLPLTSVSDASSRRPASSSLAQRRAEPDAIFGSEFEGLSPEDRDLQVARSFIRLAADAMRHLGNQAPGAHPAAAAQLALLKSARRHAPGLAAVR